MESIPLLQCFNELASVEGTKRVFAAETLISHLKNSQHAFDSQGSKLGSLPSEPSLRPMCKDLSYSVTRLVKGLTSSRGAARQGFSVALASVLRLFPNVTTADAVAQLMKETLTSGKMSKSEQRDMILGRVFGILTLERAGRLSLSGADTEVTKQLIIDLLSVIEKRPWLSTVVFSALTTLLKNCKESVWMNDLAPLLNGKISTTAAEWNADILLLVLVLESISRDWSAEIQCVSTLNYALKSSSTSKTHPLLHAVYESAKTFPAIHPVWPALINLFIELRGSSSSTANESFASFWDGVVEKGLMSSTQERRACAISVAHSLLPKLYTVPSLAKSILSSKFVAFVASNAGSKKSVHQNACRSLLTVISNAPLNSAPLLAVSLASQSPRVDALSRTFTLSSLVEKSPIETQLEVLSMMLRPLVESHQIKEEVTDSDSDSSSDDSISQIDRERILAIQSIVSLLKSPAMVALRAECLTPFINLLTALGSFNISSANLSKAAKILSISKLTNNNEGAAERLISPSPPLSNPAREQIRTLLLVFAREAASFPSVQEKSVEGVTSARISVLQNLLAQNKFISLINTAFTSLEAFGTLFPTPVTPSAVEDESDDEFDGSDEEEEDVEDERRLSPLSQRASLLTLSSHVSSLITHFFATPSLSDAVKQLSALNILINYVSLCLVMDPIGASTAASASNDIIASSSGLLAPAFAAIKSSSLSEKETPSKEKKKEKEKRKSVVFDPSFVIEAIEMQSASARGDEEPVEKRENVAVFVDALLALLANASNPLREAVKTAARALFADVDVHALQPVLDVVAAGWKGIPGASAEEADFGELSLDDEDNESVTLSFGGEDEDNAVDGDTDDEDMHEDDEEDKLSITSSMSSMSRHDRLLEHVIRQRKLAKQSAGPARQRLQHFRFRALDLVESAISCLIDVAESTQSNRNDDLPSIVYLVPALLEATRKVGFRVSVVAQHANGSGGGLSLSKDPDAEQILSRLSSLVAKACRARVRAVSPELIKPLLVRVCAVAASSPLAAVTTAAAHAQTLLIRSVKTTTGDGSGISLEGKALEVVLATVFPLVESFLSVKNSRVTLGAFRGIFIANPPLAIAIISRAVSFFDETVQNPVSSFRFLEFLSAAAESLKSSKSFSFSGKKNEKKVPVEIESSVYSLIVTVLGLSARSSYFSVKQIKEVTALIHSLVPLTSTVPDNVPNVIQAAISNLKKFTDTSELSEGTKSALDTLVSVSTGSKKKNENEVDSADQKKDITKKSGNLRKDKHVSNKKRQRED